MRAFKLSAMTLLALAAATPSLAADLPVKAAPMVPVAIYSWTGWYVGGNVGYSWGRSRTDVAYATFPGGVAIVPPAGSVTNATTNLNGWVAGGQIGYNWQSGQFVGGLETDFQWSGQRGTSNFLCSVTVIVGPCLPGLTFVPAAVTGSALSLNQKLEWFGTFRGRLGWTPTPTVLLYATGGLAYGNIQTDGILGAFSPNLTALALAGSFSQTNVGWTLGAGLEGSLGGRWTGKIEYLYMDLGTVSGTFAAAPLPVQAAFSSRITDNILRVGVNYRFVP